MKLCQKVALMKPNKFPQFQALLTSGFLALVHNWTGKGILKKWLSAIAKRSFSTKHLPWRESDRRVTFDFEVKHSLPEPEASVTWNYENLLDPIRTYWQCFIWTGALNVKWSGSTSITILWLLLFSFGHWQWMGSFQSSWNFKFRWFYRFGWVLGKYLTKCSFELFYFNFFLLSKFCDRYYPLQIIFRIRLWMWSLVQCTYLKAMLFALGYNIIVCWLNRAVAAVRQLIYSYSFARSWQSHDFQCIENYLSIST